MMAKSVLLTLSSADECTGAVLMSAGSRGDTPMAWDADPQLQTVSALFEVFERDALETCTDSIEISGEAWRDLEDSGKVDELLKSVESGYPLAKFFESLQPFRASESMAHRISAN